MIIKLRGNGGFSVVEVLLAVTVFGFLVTALIGAVVYGRASTASSGDRTRAVLLAEEGLEATRNIADASYANLVDGTYGLAQTGNQWNFSGTSDTSDIYTRQIVIATAGANRKTVTSTVTWPQAGGTTGNTSVSTRLTAWEATIAPTNSWSNAIIAGSTNVTGTNNALKTEAVGNYSYTVLNGTTNNFAVTNISNPAAPNNVATITLPGTPTNIFISGNFAYITNTSDTAELQIVNISNPAAPTVTSSLNLSGANNGLGVFVSGTKAYVSRAALSTAGANELMIVNVTNPAAPAVLGGYNNNIAMNEVYVSGTNAYVATNSTSREMLVINVSNPASPALAATYNPGTSLIATTITGFGNTVLLGMGTTLDAINVTTPTSPTRLGTFTAAGTINDVDVDATNLFGFLGTSSTTGEFQVVNLASLASMALVKTLDVPGTTSTLAGVSYNTALDLVAGASASDTQEILIFTKN